MKIDRLGGAYGIADLEIRYNIELILIQWQEKSKILLHRQTSIQKGCADSYRIVGTSIGSMVEHNHIIILVLKAEETCLSATHYSDGLKGNCVYQVHQSKEYLSAYWS